MSEGVKLNIHARVEGNCLLPVDTHMVDKCVRVYIVLFALSSSLCMCLQAWTLSGGAAKSGVKVCWLCTQTSFEW